MKKALRLVLLLSAICILLLPSCKRQESASNDAITDEITTKCTHKEIIDEAVLATCTQSGMTLGSHCGLCGITIKPQVMIPATGHKEVADEAVLPTCTTDGKTAGSHCELCGEIFVKQTHIAPLGHTEVKDEAIAPTCTETGKSEGKHCSVCGEVTSKQEVIAALGHTEITDAAVAATCTQTGLTQGKHCTVCNTVTAEQAVIPALGHTEVKDKAVAATCTKTGLTAGKHCSTCKKVLVSQKTTPKTDHVYKNQYKCDCGLYLESAKIVILSQNVRCNNDGTNKNISDRAPRLKQLVDKYRPDIIGTQETTPLWNQYLKSYFGSEYGMVGCSRNGKNATTGEWGTILYRLDRFELLDSGDFWLSSTPNKVSRVDGSLCYRICTWALLKDKVTGKTFVMANTHLDHGTDAVREQQIKYLFAGLSDLIDKYPMYLTGDFNATPGSLVYNAAISKLSDARTTALENRSTVSWTFDSYGKSNPGKIIDYCFYSDDSEALWYKVANDQFGGYVSDHYGVLTELILK